MKTFKVVSLFAGVGGICLGFKKARAKNKRYILTLANEIDKYASATYNHNFNHTLIQEDIKKIFPSHLDNLIDAKNYLDLRKKMTSEYVDILTAGFPCQAFSNAGRRLGINDERGNLFLNILEYIKALELTVGKPRILFLENVKNLKSHDNGNTYKVIKQEISKAGYIIKDAVLNTYKFTSIPQNRERIFILCFSRKDDYNKFSMFDNLENFKVIKNENQHINSIKKIIENKADEKYYYTQEKHPHYFKNDITKVNLYRSINEKNKFYQLRRGLYVRKNKNHVCPTLTANMGTGGHNVPLILDSKGIRKLTPNETFKLQGFPINKGYELPKKINGKKIGDSRFYKQAGNSVSVDLIRIIAEEILKIL